MIKRTKKYRFFKSIKFKVMACTMVLILSSIGINCTYVIQKTRSTLIENTKVTLESVTEAYSENMESMIAKLSESSDFLMSSNQVLEYIRSGGNSYAEQAQSLIEMYLTMNDSNEEISLLDENGVVLYSSNEALIGTDLSETSYYQKMEESKGSAQGDIFSLEDGETVVTFITPVSAVMQNNKISLDGSKREIAAAETLEKDMQAQNTQPSEERMEGDQPNVEGIKGQDIQTGSLAQADQSQPQTIKGAIVTVINVSEFEEVFTDIVVGEYESAEAMVLDTAGNIVYAKDSDLIGTKVETEELLQLVSQNQSVTNGGNISYTSDGEGRIAAYSYVEGNDWLLSVSIKYTDMLKSVREIADSIFWASIISVLAFGTCTYFIIAYLMAPLNRLKKSVNQTAALDFTEDVQLNDMKEKEDEIGEISKAVDQMKNSLKGMMEQIEGTSGIMGESAQRLYHSISTVNDNAKANLEIAESLSAGMEETAATTEMIHQNILIVKENASEINQQADSGAKSSEALIERAMVLKEATIEANQKTKGIYEELRVTTDHAITQAKAVDKINILAQTIMEIASQTRLLSLNASIEAARAGEAGNGFAVVASEISSLADQSAKTVNGMQEIVGEIKEAVINMSKTLDQTTSFLETTVMKDYDGFMEASDGYMTEAKQINKMMQDIHHTVADLDDSMETIASSIREINDMVEESTSQIVEVAKQNTDIVGQTEDTFMQVEKNRQEADVLNAIINNFKLS